MKKWTNCELKFIVRLWFLHINEEIERSKLELRKEKEQNGGKGIPGDYPLPSNINLKNYPCEKTPSEEPRIPGEGIQNMGEA